MNIKNLHIIFDKYIQDFEGINDSERDEEVKWRAAQAFADSFDLNSEDITSMLKTISKETEFAINSASLYPLSALIKYSENEPELIRNILKDLLSPTDDLIEKQNNIDIFIKAVKELQLKYYSENAWRYQNDQRSAMAIMFYNDPDNHYLYKATEANEFAKYMDFYEDLGSGSDFKIRTYYKMCDELVEEIKKYPRLLEKNQERYNPLCRGNRKYPDKKIYEDSQLHILAFDIMYCANAYNWYSGMSFLNTKDRKIQIEKDKERVSLTEEYDNVYNKIEHLNRVAQKLTALLDINKDVKSKAYGNGVITDINDGIIKVIFDDNKIKSFCLDTAFSKKFLVSKSNDVMNIADENAVLLSNRGNLKANEKRLLEKLENI